MPNLGTENVNGCVLFRARLESELDGEMVHGVSQEALTWPIV